MCVFISINIVIRDYSPFLYNNIITSNIIKYNKKKKKKIKMLMIIIIIEKKNKIKYSYLKSKTKIKIKNQNLQMSRNVTAQEPQKMPILMNLPYDND
jgi:hypothetical protein